MQICCFPLLCIRIVQMPGKTERAARYMSVQHRTEKPCTLPARKRDTKDFAKSFSFGTGVWIQNKVSSLFIISIVLLYNVLFSPHLVNVNNPVTIDTMAEAIVATILASFSQEAPKIFTEDISKWNFSTKNFLALPAKNAPLIFWDS